MPFRRVDESFVDELAPHLRFLNYEFKRHIQWPGLDKKAQHVLRIHKLDEVRRFCKEVGFRRQDTAKRANDFLTGKISQLH